jgi:hypothetical protein
MNTPKIMYLRDRNGNPVGCVAMVGNESDNKISYQLSVAAPGDKFVKSIGRELAIGRLVSRPINLSVNRSDKRDLIGIVMEHIADMRSDGKVFPCRAVRMARTWINTPAVNTDSV